MNDMRPPWPYDLALRQQAGGGVQPHPKASSVVSLSDVKKSYGTVVALDGLSLAVATGEICGVIGRSGAGKSTLVRCLVGLEKPESGAIHVDGTEVTDLDETALQPVRRRIGMIFQHFNLLSAKTALENVALPLKIAGLPKAARRKRALELLDLVGLTEKAKAYPAQLSGGQKQRVGIARALASDPALLLSDEATSALDPETTQQILELLHHVNRSLNVSILLITHEMEVIRQIASRVAVLDAGRVIEEGPVLDIFANPRSITTQSLLRAIRPSLPSQIETRLSQTKGDSTLLRLDVSGEHARRPLLTMVAEAAGVSATLVHGGLSDVAGQPFGSLFVAVATTAKPVLRDLRARLEPVVARYEELGRVDGYN
jgi:D-methionine transport system ATP-binding protein